MTERLSLHQCRLYSQLSTFLEPPRSDCYIIHALANPRDSTPAIVSLGTAPWEARDIEDLHLALGFVTAGANPHHNREHSMNA